MTKKIKIKYRTLFLFMLVITIGCVPKDDNSKNKDEITGTEGLTIEFIKNFPQAKITWVIGKPFYPLLEG